MCFIQCVRSDKTYTGRCHKGTKQKNDQLSWLWAQSTALYPSIYLPQRLAGSMDAALMIRYEQAYLFPVLTQPFWNQTYIKLLCFLHSDTDCWRLSEWHHCGVMTTVIIRPCLFFHMFDWHSHIPWTFLIRWQLSKVNIIWWNWIFKSNQDVFACRRIWSTHLERAHHSAQPESCCGERWNSPNQKYLSNFIIVCVCVCIQSAYVTKLSCLIYQKQCILLREYIHNILGPFIQTLRANAMRCSLQRCRSHGRCARRRPNSGHWLSSASISQPHDDTDSASSEYFQRYFVCHCYLGWSGPQCQRKGAGIGQNKGWWSRDAVN